MPFIKDMNRLIAVVDDEPDILELVSLHLKKAGYGIRIFSGAKSFFRFLDDNTPDLVILDLMLPDMDGMEICRRLKTQPPTAAIPIIMLTARGEESDRVLGLEMGADDYVSKPFSPRELVARVKAVLRRKGPSEEGGRIEAGGILEINRERHEVLVKGSRVDLTATEFRILTILAENKERVFTRDQVLNLLWGEDKAVLDRTIDVHIKNARAKLGPAGKLIVNVRGIGYKLRE